MKIVNYDNLETAKEMIKVALDKKVDKESDKGLSTNDYTNEEKTKLAGIEEEANKTIVDSELSLESTNPVQNKIVSEELNTKANKVEVEEALNTKADKVAVEEALNTKADKIAVEEALETKADKQEVAVALDAKVDKETGKGLSTNDFTNEEKEKLSKLDINSNENIIEVIKQNGQVLEIQDKSVNIVTITEDIIDNKIEEAVKNVEVDLTDYAQKSDVPKNVSDLFNDLAFISSSDEKDPTVPSHVKAITEEDIAKWNSGTGSGSGSSNVIVSPTEPTTGEDVWVQTCRNLFIPSMTKKGYYIKASGSLGYKADDRYFINNYMEIEPNTVYTASETVTYYGGYHAWYDADKNFISSFTQPNGETFTVTSPSNAKYIRFSLYNDTSTDIHSNGSDLDSFQFVKGTTVPPYSAHFEGSKIYVNNNAGGYDEIYDSEAIPEIEQYILPAATADTLGGIKVGDNLTIDADGTLHAQAGGSGGSGGSSSTISGSEIIYQGQLKGNESVVLDKAKRFLVVYFVVYLSNHRMFGEYTIDTSLTEPSFGSTVFPASDGSTGLSYYTSEGKFEVSTKTFTHFRTGYFNIGDDKFYDRNERDTYYIYRIDTYDEPTLISAEQNNGNYMWIHNSAPFALEPETITKIPFDKLLDDTSSGKLIHEDGGIRIGKGVKQILVISKWNSWTYDCQKYIYVYKNGAGYESAGFQNGAWTANVVSYVNVTEGDFIEIYGYHNYSSSMNIASNNQQSGLKVIVLGETTNVEVTGDVITHSDSAVILYDNEEGSNGPITLSEDLSNFKYVDIFYSYAGNMFGYEFNRIYKPDGKIVYLNTNVLNNERMYSTVSAWVLNGTEMSQTKGERFRFGITPDITRTTDTTDILIHRVIGYHEESNAIIIGNLNNSGNVDLSDYVHKNDLYYKKGDKMIIDFPITVPGLVTSSTKRLMFTITSPKLLTNIDSITCTKCDAELRGNNGYVNNETGYKDYTTLSGYTVSCAKACENMIQIYVDKSSAYTNISNNTMVIIRAYFEFDLL